MYGYRKRSGGNSDIYTGGSSVKNWRNVHADILWCFVKCFPANLRQVGETLGTLSIAVDLSQLIQCHAECWVGAATAAVLPITLWHSTHIHWSIQSFQCQAGSQNFVNWGCELATAGAGWLKLFNLYVHICKSLISIQTLVAVRGFEDLTKQYWCAFIQSGFFPSFQWNKLNSSIDLKNTRARNLTLIFTQIIF